MAAQKIDTKALKALLIFTFYSICALIVIAFTVWALHHLLG